LFLQSSSAFRNIYPYSLSYLLQFETIQFLFALIALLPLIALFIGIIYWKRWVRHKLGDKRLVDQLVKNYSPKLYNAKIILVLVAIALGILAAANIRRPAKAGSEKGAGVDVMIMLDVSKSMLSQDAKPTRLDKAKQFINDLLPKLENNRVGLVLFAGQSFLQMPLTPDIAATRMFVSNAGPDAVPVQGTVFSEALALANSSLDVKEKKYKTAILITDGEDNDEAATETAKELYEAGVAVHAIGIGSSEGSNIIEPGATEPKKDFEGNIIVSKLNEDLLRKIASVTKGSYHRLENVSETSGAVAAEINSMEKKGFTAGANVDYINYFPVLIALALLLLITEVFIPEKKWNTA
jgi:Ca-activated chloride channel family protein